MLFSTLRGSGSPKGRPISYLFCDAPMYRRPVCSLQHTISPLDLWNSEGFPEFPRTDSSQRESAVGPYLVVPFGLIT